MEHGVKHNQHGVPQIMTGRSDVFRIIVTTCLRVILLVVANRFLSVINIAAGFFNRIVNFDMGTGISHYRYVI